MELKLLPLNGADLPAFKRDMQVAFRLGAEVVFGPQDEEILPEADIDSSLNATGSAAYKAMLGNEMVGGAVVVIDEKTGCNHLDLLYVKAGCQGQHIGQFIWQEIEGLYPDTKVWETHTPYFEKRNLHFYINQCGFHAVEFFNAHHPDPHSPSGPEENGYFDGFFRFEKQMK